MSELIKHFGIDWRLLLAQAVNFLILLWVLKRYVYRPILEMLRKRRLEIEKGLEFTERAKEKLRHVEKEQEEILKQTRVEAMQIVTVAEDAAKKRKQEILYETNIKAEGVIAEARRLIEEDKSKTNEEIYRNAGDLVKFGIERVLGKLPPEVRDEHLIKEALRELKSSV